MYAAEICVEQPVLFDRDRAAGMTRSSYRMQATGEPVRAAVAPCALGCVAVAATAKGICAILLGSDAEELLAQIRGRFVNAHVSRDPAFGRLVGKIAAFVDDPHGGLRLRLDLRGTAFQLRVWEALRKVPVGSTCSYSDIAQHLNMPQAMRAVGRACAANMLAVAVPCHRVVSSNGSLTGYRWGLERKRALLAREKAAGALRA